MMTTIQKPARARLLPPFLLALLVSCEDAQAAQEAAAPASAAQEAEELELPRPEVELPELPYDKSELAEVRALDAMIVESRHLAAAVEAFEKMFHALQDATDVSMSGTSEDQIRAAMVMVDGFREFDRRAVPFGKKAEAQFKKNHASDDAFGSTFREVYARAEEELWEAIEDNEQRRTVGAAMSNGYRYMSGSNVAYLESMLEESAELRAGAVDRIVQSVQTDMLVADYKKGSDLVDLLRASRSKLEVVRVLDADGQRVDGALAEVVAKEASRKEDIAAARAAYRFPERYDEPNRPSDFNRLEEEMRSYLKKKKVDARWVTLASEWIKVHSVFGIHLYSQIDFYVAVPNEEEKGVLDVLYVTGKTSGPEPRAAFSTVSVGTIAQMLEKNL